MEIKWGIIGVGDVTEVKSGPAFNKVAGSRLQAVMRRDEEKVKSYARRHGVPVWYTDARRLIDDPEVNAIYIATPPDTHASYAKEALLAGKPVYLEKPMTRNSSEARELCTLVEERGAKLSVAHYRREQPYFKKLKELVGGQIGTPLLVTLQYLRKPLTETVLQSSGMQWRLNPQESGGGLFHDIAPHQIDLIYQLFGEVLHATGTSHNQAGLYTAEDVVSGQLLFKNKVIFNGLWAFNAPEERDFCEVIGSEGKVRFSFFDYQPIELENAAGRQVFSFEPLAHVQQPMISAVVQYFQGQRNNPCSVEDGLRVIELMEAFLTMPIFAG